MTDPAVAAFRDIYDENDNTIKATSLSLAQSSFSVDYIQASVFLTTFDPLNAIEASTSAFQPSFSYSSSAYTSSSNQYTINSMKLSEAGSVYFILVFNKKITNNTITGHTDIEIRPAVVPSGEQIVNCLDGENRTPLDCRRVVFMKNVPRSVTFTNITSNQVHLLYYVVANEYPLRPVLTSSVSNFTIDSSSEQWNSLKWISLLILIAMLWL